MHVVVATPGRIFDLAKKGEAKLDQCQMLVLDEVDKLLSDEFKEVIENIIQMMKPAHQILLFSATYPVEIKEF